MYGEGNSPALNKWTSRLAVKQARAGVDEDLEGLNKAFQCLVETEKTGDLELEGTE